MVPPFAGGIAAFEQDDDPELLLLYPCLQMAELDLELAELLLIGLAFHPRWGFFVTGHQSPQAMAMSPGTPPGKSTIWYLMR
jgi:hypothetical protein